MKNYKTDDDGVLNLIAPAGGVLSGVPVRVGALLVVPHKNAVEGESFAARYRGEFELGKVEAEPAGQLAAAYFDSDAGLITTDDEKAKVGYFTAAAVGGDAVARVMLTGVVQ